MGRHQTKGKLILVAVSGLFVKMTTILFIFKQIKVCKAARYSKFF